MNIMRERMLINQLRAKDPAALRKLIDSYQCYVVSIIRNIGRGALNENDTEELAADVFLAVWQTADKIQEGKLQPYIAAIARNETKSRLRSLKESVSLEDTIVIEAADLQEEVEHTLLAEALRDAIESLPKQDGEVLIRYYYYYQQVIEIAKEMGLSSSAVKVRLHRSRNKLKQLLIERGYTYETESI